MKTFIVVTIIFGVQIMLAIAFQEFILVQVLREYFKPSVSFGIAIQTLFYCIAFAMLIVDIVAVLKPSKWTWVNVGWGTILFLGILLQFTSVKALFILGAYIVAFVGPLFLLMLILVNKDKATRERKLDSSKET